MNLIEIADVRQVCTFAPYVGERCYCVPRQLPLHIEMPLLHIGPEDLTFNDAGRKVVDERRRKSATTAYACVSGCRRRAAADTWSDVGLAGSQDSRGRTFQ